MSTACWELSDESLVVTADAAAAPDPPDVDCVVAADVELTDEEEELSVAEVESDPCEDDWSSVCCWLGVAAVTVDSPTPSWLAASAKADVGTPLVASVSVSNAASARRPSPVVPVLLIAPPFARAVPERREDRRSDATYGVANMHVDHGYAR